MKKIKILSLFFILVLLVGCTNKEDTVKEIAKESSSSQVSAGVNMDDLGNIMNGQYYFDDGEQIFYSTFDEKGASHIYMQKNDQKMAIFDGFGWSFAYKEGYLFFSGNEGTTIDGTYNLYRMKIADGSYQKINTSYCFNMYFYDSFLYYTKEVSDEIYAIYRSNLDGTDEMKVVDNAYSSIVYENKLYYLKEGFVYQAEPDGSSPKIVLDDKVEQFIIGQGKIIYLDATNNIKVSDIDGTNISTVRVANDIKIFKINSYKETIYYVSYENTYLSDRKAYPYTIYSIKMNKEGYNKIYEGVSWGYYVNVVNEKVYVLDYAQDLTINKFVAITSRMNLDGSNITRLYR